MKREEAFAFTEKCINGEPATCIAACPFHLDIKAFLKKAAKGRIGAAAQELNKSLPFPVLISELCPHPCQDVCQRKTVLGEETIDIRLLERSCANSNENKERKTYTLESLPQRAAVVGAGPAGLACALHLSRKRFPVTVFEKEPGWGGSLRDHLRFPAFEAEWIRKFASADVTFCFGQEVADLSELDAFDVVFLATGKDGEDFGLRESLDPSLGTTGIPRIFMGGEMTGAERIDGIAQTLDISKAMESWLQTGNASYASVNWEKTGCSRDVPHPNEAPTEHVVPTGEFYTKEEIQTEASRCMQCDCEECFKDCDLLTKFKKKPPRIAIDVAQDGMTRNSVSTACITRQTWSCNQCGHCAQVCEEHVDIGGLFELSRKDRVKSNLYPPAFHGYWMREMEEAVSSGALLRPAPNGAKETSYLFFPGCRLGGVHPDYPLKSYEALLGQHKETGIWLGCCGIPALWAGEEDQFVSHIEKMREDWEQMGSPAVIYACASCRRTFARFLPEVPLISLYEMLEQGLSDGTIRTAETGTDPKAAQTKYDVFDPCAAYGMGEVKEAVRKLAGRTGGMVTAYDSNGKCCGYGGHIQLANPDFYDEVANRRCSESEEMFLTYCVNCMEVFAAHGKETRHILDLIFHMDQTRRKMTTLEEKRENNRFVKQRILETYWNEAYRPETEPWDALSVEVPETVQSEMERLLIPLRDVKKTIYINEEAGEGFENQFGEVLCRMVGDYLTCWVKYQKEDEIYHLREVYAHRMHIREDER